MKTKPIQINLSPEIWEAVKAAAAEDDRPMTLFLTRLLKAHPMVVKHLPEELRPRAATPTRQTAFTSPIPSGKFPGPASLELTPSDPSNPLAEPLPEPLAPTDDLPIEQWENDRLVNTLVEKRTHAQEERARIATIGNLKEQEAAKTELERALVFIGVLEREFNKRRVKQPKKAPQPPRANPQPRLS